MTTVPPDAPGADPLEVFAGWRAGLEGTPDADVLAVATATPTGAPSVRLVLLRGITERGVRFFTNYESRKGAELSANPRCAAVWFDPVGRRQVRLEGTATEVDAAVSDAYFASRDRGHQLGAVASHQSSVLADRAMLEDAYREAEARYAGGDVGRPPRWGGYELAASAVELWVQRGDRLHDRFAYVREDGGWSVVRLAP